MGASSSTRSSEASHCAWLAGTFRGPFSERYEVLRQLGSGAQGAAYLVRERAGGRECVAKETHDMTPEGKETFVEEFRKMRELHHPNCTRVIELVEGTDFIRGQWKEQIWVVTELARGGDLFKYMQMAIRSQSTLTEEWVAGVFAQAMHGVAYIHSKGIVHNDLKPDNILMLDEFSPMAPEKVPWVVINDFGCATLRGDSSATVGDPRYQSPEAWQVMRAVLDGQGASFRKLDAKTDVWSMAVTLFELLSGGRLPFLYRPCTVGEVCGQEAVLKELEAAVLGQTVQVKPHCVGVSLKAEDLLNQMFSNDPARRPSAEEVLHHRWFSVKGSPLSKSVTRKFELHATKGAAHRILLNAFAMKLQREHYDACFRVFEEVDSNHSGQIGITEFAAAFHQLGMGAADVHALFHQADLDKDGQLDFPEFMAATFDWKSLEPMALQQSLEAFFTSLDTKSTGDLDDSEFIAIFQGALGPEEVREVFSRIDTNADSRISIQELGRFLFEPEEKLVAPAMPSAPRDSISTPSLAEPEAVPPPKEEEPPPNEEVSDAAFFGGTVLPVAVGCACLCWTGLWKLF